MTTNTKYILIALVVVAVAYYYRAKLKALIGG